MSARKVFCALSFLILGACSSAAQNTVSSSEPAETKPAAAAGPEVPYVQGGAKIVRAPAAEAGQLAVRVLFYAGSIDDPKGKEGLTALTAKLVVEGGTQKRTYAELLRALYPLASEIGVQVDKEQTVFSGSVHPETAATFVPIMAEVLTEPRFDERDFERIRADMVNDIEKRLRSTDDENLGKAMLDLMLYSAGHPYAHFVGGTVQGLKSITIEDVKKHAVRVFGKQRMLIGVGGQADDGAEELLQSALSALGEGEPRVASIPAPEKPQSMEVLIAEKPSKAVAISMGFPHDAFRGHPDFSALALLQSYLGEHRQFHGLLMSELREKRGLNYGDYAYVEKFIQEGWGRNPSTNVARRRQHFEIWIRPVDPKDAIFSIRLALYFTNRTLERGLSEESVRKTAEFLDGYTRLWDLTALRKVGYALDDHFYGTSDYLDRFRSDLKLLKAEDVNRAMRAHLRAQPIKIAIVAPDAAALKAKLVSGEPSPKAYDVEKSAEILAADKEASVWPLQIREQDVRIVKASELFER